MITVDFNSDLGESFGNYTIGDDAMVLPMITSANVACGFHAGDPDVMAKTVTLAQQNQVAVGAHPGYPDLAGFGRRKMTMSHQEVADMVTYQVAALQGFLPDHHLHHVKPHGALYNAAAKDLELALAICEGIKRVDPSVPLYGLANSELIRAGQRSGLPVRSEVFADRAYQADGSLVPRSQMGAVLTDPQQVAQRALTMVTTGTVTAITGETVKIVVDTICVHGDNAAARQLVTTMRAVFNDAGINIHA